MNPTTSNPWNQFAVAPKYAALAANIRVDVCIIGGGIAGLTTAYLMQREGKTVCLLEANEIGSGESNRSTSHLTCALDIRYSELERLHGADAANLAAKSHTAAISKIEEIVREEKIECELQRLDGYLFAGASAPTESLDRELAAAQRAGISGVAIVEKSVLPFYDLGRSLKFPSQMQMRPAPYEAAIARAISRDCGKIHTKTKVSKVDSTSTGAVVSTDTGFNVTANSVIIATNSALGDVFKLDEKQTAYQTYVVGFAIPKASVPRALYWDTLNPYHYVRLSTLSSEEDLLIVGGEDQLETAGTDGSAAYAKLVAWTQERFPMAKEPSYRWSGEILEPADGLAFLGREPQGKKNLFVISGESGNGITNATIGAILIADQMMGRPNAWEEIYDPARKALSRTV